MYEAQLRNLSGNLCYRNCQTERRAARWPTFDLSQKQSNIKRTSLGLV